MQREAFEKRMRALERFHSLHLLPGAWVVVHVDGRGFSQYTASRFAKPIDDTFHTLMVHTAQALLVDLQGCYAYTESDEISVLCGPDWALFDRRLEKVVSISAASASAAFTQACGMSVHFDSRVWLGAEAELVVDYFRWRQTMPHGVPYTAAVAGPCNRLAKVSRRRQACCKGVSRRQKRAALPAWDQLQHSADLAASGHGLYWEDYRKEGLNPQQQCTVRTTRRRLKIDLALPMKDGYAQLLRGIMHRSRVPVRTRRAI